jgi:hypothetical protein
LLTFATIRVVALNISAVTLWRKMKQYGLVP